MNRFSAFWKKHRIPMIVLLSLLTVALLVTRKYIRLNKDVLAAGLFVNVTIEDSARESLENSCREHLTTGGRWEKVRLSQVTMADFGKANLEYRTDYHTLSSILSLNENGEVDLLLTDQTALETLIRSEVFLDLRQFLPEETLEALGTKVIYVRSSEMAPGESYPVAVDISELPFVREYMTTPDRVYFSIGKNSPRQDALVLLWELITGE